MLGRLIKYDMKSVSRLGLPLSIIVLVAAIFGTAALKVVVNAPDNAPGIPIVVCTTCVVAAVIAIFAYTVIVWVLLLRRFYTNMFTDEGYLTFTLPVSSKALISSKLISAVIWSVISSLVSAVCVLMLLIFGSGEKFLNFEWLDWVKQLAEASFISLDIWDLTISAVYMLVSTVFSFLLIYLSITIAAVITRKNKIIVAIGMYYGINMLVSIFTSIGELIPVAATGQMDAVTVSGLDTMSTTINIIIYAVFAIAAFVVCDQLMKKKLNID